MDTGVILSTGTDGLGTFPEGLNGSRPGAPAPTFRDHLSRAGRGARHGGTAGETPDGPDCTGEDDAQPQVYPGGVEGAFLSEGETTDGRNAVARSPYVTVFPGTAVTGAMAAGMQPPAVGIAQPAPSPGTAVNGTPVGGMPVAVMQTVPAAVSAGTGTDGGKTAETAVFPGHLTGEGLTRKVPAAMSVSPREEHHHAAAGGHGAFDVPGRAGQEAERLAVAATDPLPEAVLPADRGAGRDPGAGAGNAGAGTGTDRALPAEQPLPEALSPATRDDSGNVMAVARAILRLRREQGGEEAYLTVRLKPAALGELSLRVTWQEGRVAAHFTASSLAARDLIEGSLGDLRDLLLRKGVPVEGFSVEVAPGYGGERAAGGQAGGGGGYGSKRRETAALAPSRIVDSRFRVSRGLVPPAWAGGAIDLVV